MIFLNGKVINSTNYRKAVLAMEKQIGKTLSKREPDPQTMIRAAERLSVDILKESPKHVSMYSASAAKLFSSDSLRKKLETELSGTAKRPGDGDRFMNMPIGVLLHIVAGNMEGLAAYSVLEGLLAGNINILKLPSGDSGLSLYLLKKLTEYEPRLKEYIYIMDTPSGDKRTMKRLMEMAGGIAVWGSDNTVRAVRRMAPANTKLIEWGHKLSFAYIEDLYVPEEKLAGLARHIFASEQLLCNSCQVIYLNTDEFEEVKKFSRRFAGVMKREGEAYGNPLFLQGKITVEMLTRKLERAGGTTCVFDAGNGSVTCVGDDKLELSGQFGNVLLKPLPRERLVTTLYPYRRYLQTAGIYPVNEELTWMLARCGLTNLCGLEDMERFEIPGSHDGTFALREYSRIVECRT